MKKVKVQDPVKELRNGLHRHRGSINEVARRAEVSREFVRLVLKKERNSNTVLKVAADVLLEREKISQAVRGKVMDTVQQVAAMGGASAR